MARKSKGKFNMKGHSIPGIKGFKDTTLEDGRAASSAFQMQSPLHEEGDDTYKVNPIHVESSDFDPNRAEKRAAGQSGLGYMGQEFSKLEWRDGKLVRKGSEVEDEITEQVDKYDDTTDTHNQYDVAPEDMIQDANGNWVPREGAKSLTYGDTWSDGGWKDDATTESVADSHDKEIPTGPDLSTHTTAGPEEVVEAPVEEAPVDYSEATKNEMYDLRRPFKDDGSWDPDNNPEHADIQNKINELHGSDVRY